MAVTEITTSVNVQTFRDYAWVHIEGESLMVDYEHVAGVSRALHVVKESKHYAAWLKRKGLA